MNAYEKYGRLIVQKQIVDAQINEALKDIQADMNKPKEELEGNNG